MRRTKIVATVGPACRDPQTIRRLVSQVDVFRINFSHGDHPGHLEEISSIRAAAKATGRQVAILQDLPGPKIRVGKMKNGAVELAKGSSFLLTAADVLGDETIATLNYPDLLKSVKRGTVLHLADGTIRLRVESVTEHGVSSIVLAGGTLSSGKGVNAPGVKMHIDYPTPQDSAHLKFGLTNGVDYVGLSFIRTAADVKAVRKLLRGTEAALIAKIEKREAVANFDAILEEADGVMVARGDLGIETPAEKVPIIQKEIIAKCNSAGKPVIVATQMLVSMVNFPLPTRAEVTDVSTAILDGTDAVMLSDETAVGKYPVEAVETLDRVSRATERVRVRYTRPKASEPASTTGEAIARAACQLADYIGARAIVAPTQSGATATRVSKQRPSQPIVALCPDVKVARRMMLYWGVKPLVARRDATADALFKRAERAAVKLGLAKRGDRIVLTSGTPGLEGSTDLIKVSSLR